MASQLSAILLEECQIVVEILTTFKEDSINFIKAFEQKQTFSYEIFKTDWAGYPMVEFFNNLPGNLRNYGGQFYDIICELIKDGTDFYKIGALYYLYTLYRNSYCGAGHKIPIMFHQYEKLRLLVSTLLKSKHIEDIGLAFNHLRLAHAFEIIPDLDYAKNSVVIIEDGVFTGDFTKIHQAAGKYCKMFAPNGMNPDPINFAICENLQKHLIIAECLEGVHP